MRTLQEEQRRARSAAFGVGTAFAGAGLILLPVSMHAALLSFVGGFSVTAWMFYRSVAVERRARHRPTRGVEGDRVQFTLDDIATALVELRREAAATEGLLRRVRSQR